MKKKKEKFANPYPEFKRLKFLRDFMKMDGLNTSDMARFMGMTRPAVGHWFDVDDVQMSTVRKLIEGRGYRFNIRIREKDDHSGEGLALSIDDIFHAVGHSIKLKRLSFLTIAMHENNISERDIAERLRLSHGAVRKWFNDDDILISRLFQIIDEYNLSIEFDMSKETSFENYKRRTSTWTPPKGREYVVRVSTETVMEF